MSLFFFRRPKPRQFNYRPRYYNPDQEEAELRKKEREALDSDDPAERLRAQIKRRWRTDRNKTEDHNKIISYIFYFTILALTVYLIFFSDLVNKMVSLFVR